MAKHSKHKNPSSDRTISWERVRAIFDNPEPPKHVWERQFDYLDNELRRLAGTPFEEINFSDLWYYHHDLAYVELQPELFAYLFPVCLMDWHVTLMNNEACSHGDAEFHYGVRRGDVFQKMMTIDQRAAVVTFFRDSFLERLGIERRFASTRNRAATYSWIYRFNSLGLVIPNIEVVWNAWWQLDSPEQAVAALQYCSGLMFFEGENSVFGIWDGIVPEIWLNDSFIYDAGWLDENIAFLSKTLTPGFVNEKVVSAVARLSGGPEWEHARQLEERLPDCQELIQVRLNELPRLLRNPNSQGWTV